ncbi:MAG: beta-propeller domain-containing protein [Patescibacteria group bacterium]
MSRILTARLSALLLFAAAAPAFAFTDVSSKTSYNRAINALQEQGVVEGYSDGSFKASTRINRAEFLKIVLESRGDISDLKNCFPDVNGEWFANYVCTAKSEGIVSGYPDGSFKPEQEINFVEAGKILALAYGQKIEQNSSDWYEPYARALESSYAIPPSIGTLDQKLSRGEMAEMMWRLSGDITNEPAKGYMNVKYPEMQVNLASDTPQVAKSCVDLQAFTEEAGRSGGGYGMEDNMLMRGEAMPTMAPQAGAPVSELSNTKSADYSETNIQVEGVDEGDIVKTDGEYLYIVRNQEIRIVDATPASNLRNVATINLADTSFSPSDLYVEDDRLVVIGSRWDPDGPIYRPLTQTTIWPSPAYHRSYTTVQIYDVSDASNPKLSRTVSFEGNSVSTRRIGDKLYVVVNQSPRYWGGPVPLGTAVKEMDLVPTIKDSAKGDTAMAAVPCNDVVILPRVPSPSYLIVGVVPLNNNSDVQRTAILGNGENIYASLENLYVAATDWQYAWNNAAENVSQQRTRLYRFDFTNDGATFQAQGQVPGRILNQFSMDEHGSTSLTTSENYFRIATTIDEQWMANNTTRASSNNLYVLNRSMETVGSLTDLAPGEKIYSTRFLGDRAYMVTFRTIDPLFVIDMSDPRNPEILGKLKIPGYSDYLHPYDENHIIGFGKDAEVSKDGQFAWQQGMKIALFDVSDVENPVELHKISIGDRGTESPLLHNHKALLFDKERDLLAFPVNIHKVSSAQQSGDPSSAWGEPVFQGAQVYSLTLDGGFKLRGQVTHYSDTDWQKAGSYVYGKDIDRIVRIGESLYTTSQWGVVSVTEDTVKKEGSLAFDVPTPITGGSCPDAKDPDVHYVSTDPDECSRVRFACVPGTEAFSDMCGCGCK